MTYNFDPEGWLERQRAALEARRARGEIDESGFNDAFEELDRRYDEMVERLDGTYEIPAQEPPNRTIHLRAPRPEQGAVPMRRGSRDRSVRSTTRSRETS
jgi:hypothetical protein